MTNIKFWDIQILVINSELNSRIFMQGIETSEIGTKQVYHLEDIEQYEYLKSFSGALISKNDPRYHEKGIE